MAEHRQGWDEILPPKSKIDANVHKRLRNIQISEPISVPDYTSTAINREKKAKLAQTHKTVQKYVPIVYNPETAIKPQRFGHISAENLAPEALNEEPAISVSPIDEKLTRMLKAAVMTKAGARSSFLNNLPAAAEITKQRATQIKSLATGILAQDQAARRRINAIKSKTAKRIHRLENLKKQARVLQFIEAEDPETAAQMKLQLEEKRASLRSLKEHKARKRWARIAAKFHGGQINTIISQSFEDAKEYKNIITKLAGTKPDEESDGSDWEEDFDAELNSESYLERRQKIIHRAEAKISNILDTAEAEKGVAAMPFMKISRKKYLEKQKLINGEYIRLLKEGHSEKDAAVLAKQRFVDDFESNFEDIPDMGDLDEEFVQKKLEAAKSAEEATKGSSVSATHSRDQVASVFPLSAADKLNFGIKISKPAAITLNSSNTHAELSAAKFEADESDIKSVIAAFYAENHNHIQEGETDGGITGDSILVRAAFATDSNDAEGEWQATLAQEALDRAKQELSLKPRGKETQLTHSFVQLCVVGVHGPAMESMTKKGMRF